MAIVGGGGVGMYSGSPGGSSTKNCSGFFGSERSTASTYLMYWITASRSLSGKSYQGGMAVPRVFSIEGVSPFDQVDWDRRTAEIKDERGRVIFQQTDCEIPRSWSELGTRRC